jgi:hypothetical protein
MPAWRAKATDSPFPDPYYLSRMLKRFEFCLQTLGKAVPAGPDWFHEINFDSYRLRLDHPRVAMTGPCDIRASSRQP